MIRSRSIPLVLSRVAGDGIHAILLIDNDGELLGSYGSPPPPRSPTQEETNGGGSAITSQSDIIMSQHWPLDAASIGALISEVAGDYRRMGQDLLLLDPQNYSQWQGGVGAGSSDVDRHRGQLLQQQLQQEQDGSLRGGVDSNPPSLQQTELAGKTSMEKSDSGTNLKSLVVELDYVSATLGEYCNPLRDCILNLTSIFNTQTVNFIDSFTMHFRGSLEWLVLALGFMSLPLPIQPYNMVLWREGCKRLDHMCRKLCRNLKPQPPSDLFQTVC